MIILRKELEEAEKLAKERQKAINNASALIDDAVARYVKKKTRAKSKKAAMEKGAALTSPRFNKLVDYDRREDIQNAYGYDCITAGERDRLEELWDEREEIRNSTTEDGIYSDLVTKAMHEAWIHIQDLWSEDITKYEAMKKAFDKQVDEADKAIAEFNAKVDADYKKFVEGK